jgi:hypothetical protein
MYPKPYMLRNYSFSLQQSKYQALFIQGGNSFPGQMFPRGKTAIR